MMYRLKLCAVVLSALLFACSDDTSNGNADATPPQPDTGPCSATSPRSVPLTVSVLPDDGEKPYVDLINGATKTVRVYCYLMGYGGIFDALKQQAGTSVDVRIIFDRSQQSANQKYYTELKTAGADVQWSEDKYTHTHAKVIIADDTAAVISTGNYSYTSAIKRNRDYVARTADPDDLADLINLFDADWNRGAPLLPCTRLLVSPINAQMRITQLIDSATSTLDIQSMQFAETKVRDAVAARKNAGVQVRVMMADPSWVTANTNAANFLGTHNIPARYMKDPGVHAKAIIVDGKRAYLGSVNMSYTSMTKNREVGVVVLDGAQVQRMTSTFEKDWPTGTPF